MEVKEMTALEIKIIEAVREIRPINGYGYKTFEDLRVAIAEAMGYEIKTSWRYGKQIANHEDYEKIYKIIDGMKKKNIIKFSKSGSTFKMV